MFVRVLNRPLLHSRFGIKFRIVSVDYWKYTETLIFEVPLYIIIKTTEITIVLQLIKYTADLNLETY